MIVTGCGREREKIESTQFKAEVPMKFASREIKYLVHIQISISKESIE